MIKVCKICGIETTIIFGVEMHRIGSKLVKDCIIGTCEWDGFYTDIYDNDHYWHCEEPVFTIIHHENGQTFKVCKSHFLRLKKR